jgi:ribosomal protein S27E
MAEIRFQCPDCKQRMTVEEDAAGIKVDCPTCRSTLVVPATDHGVPEVEVPRRITVRGGTQAEFSE